ncbi:MAG: hypothetical protein HYV99_06445 [Betaproteobacteria bacterium]|nr:hypothetical protein [Betaproteobacteria bacterium]
MRLPGFYFPIHRLRRARLLGQASMEYTVVVFFAVLVLIVPDANGNVAIVQVANAIKSFYTAFAYAMSFSTTLTPF